MTQPRTAALQLCPLSGYFEQGLAARFDVIRWYTCSEVERNDWLRQHAATVHAVITGGHIGCSTALMQALPLLKIIAVNGVGVDKVDLDYAQRRGIRIATTPGALTEDVADLAAGLTIGLLRGIPAADSFVRNGDWINGDLPLARQVSGRRFGVVGLGHIGSAIAARLAPFGPVAYTGPTRKSVPYAFHPSALALAWASDVMVLACPANATTRHLVNAEVLDALGPEGYLVNVARGAVVDELALIAALATGRLGGAALDVYENEPHVPVALRHSPRVILTPHMASATIETRIRMADMLFASLDTLNTPPVGDGAG
jgi:lactate dehydrogenase-like 2-hydroxyacid dehydrogenase